MIERYSTPEMDAIWNEQAKFDRYTRIEKAACKVFHKRKQISDEEMEIIDAGKPPTPERVSEIEKETDHDIVAFVKAFTENMGPAGRHVHRGLTSSDIVDTSNAMAVRDSLEIILNSLDKLCDVLKARALEFKHTLCIGRTHGMHAEPTTFGLRIAGWFLEASRNRNRIRNSWESMRRGKLSGAVGNYSQTDPDFEMGVVRQLELYYEVVATQVVPRDRHAEMFSSLAILGASIERIALEIRHLQRTEVREVQEKFKLKQKGSSAMPHKRNPILSERLCGMARVLRGYMVTALENVALWHDRDISHSSTERIIMPDALHLTHYMLIKVTKLLDNLIVYPDNMFNNMKNRELCYSQNILDALLSKGMDRQRAYDIVQLAAMKTLDGKYGSLSSGVINELNQLYPEDNYWYVQDVCKPDKYIRHVDYMFGRAGIK